MNTEHCSLTHRAVGGKLRCIYSRTGDNMMSRRTGGAHVHTTRTVHTEKYTVSIMSGASQREPLYMLAVCNVLGHL